MMNKIPKGWEIKKLGEICEINPKTEILLLNESDEVSFIPMASVEAETNIFTESKSKFSKVKKGYTKFRDNDILFAKITPCMENGKICIVNNLKFGIGFGSTEFHVIRPNKNTLSKYIYYFVSQISFRQMAQIYMTGAVGQRRVPSKILENFEIPLPPLSEQKAIADKLDDSFAKIENAITNLINAKENLKLYKQSVLKSAFNGDLLPNTSPTQRKKVKFEDVLKYEQPTKYIVKSTKYNNDFKTPVLTAGKGFILGYTNETEGIFTNTPVIIFDDFTTSSQYVNFHFKVKSSAMKILRPVDNVNLKFLFYKMQTIQHKSDTHKRYWISEYAKLEIPLPPLSEQNLIVAEIDRRFAIVDKTLNLIDKSIQNAKNLKQSILKKAFSGELRSDI